MTKTDMEKCPCRTWDDHARQYLCYHQKYKESKNKPSCLYCKCPQMASKDICIVTEILEEIEQLHRTIDGMKCCGNCFYYRSERIACANNGFAIPPENICKEWKE